MKILSYLPRQDLIAIAVVHRKFRSIVQNMLFAHVGFHACDGNGVAQTPAKKLLSFFFALLCSERLRSHVLTLHLDLDCNCKDIGVLAADARSSQYQNTVVQALARITQHRVPYMDDFERRVHQLVGAWCVLKDHDWFTRVSISLLHLVPKLRNLSICMRGWGDLNFHDLRTERVQAELQDWIHEQIEQVVRVPADSPNGSTAKLHNLQVLSLRTRALANEWTNSDHAFAELFILPNIESIDVDDVLLNTLPSRNVVAQKMTIHARPFQHRLAGGGLQRLDHNDAPVAFFRQCPKLWYVDIQPRGFLEIANITNFAPLTKKLRRLRVQQTLDTSLNPTPDLSTLHNLKRLDINWTFLCAAAYNPRTNTVGKPLPASLQVLHIISPPDIQTWSKPSQDEIATLKTQLIYYALSHYDTVKAQYARPLKVVVDLFPAFLTYVDVEWADFEVLRDTIMDGITGLKWAEEKKVMEFEWRFEADVLWWDVYYTALHRQWVVRVVKLETILGSVREGT